jgi:hypothetical protein
MKLLVTRENIQTPVWYSGYREGILQFAYEENKAIDIIPERVDYAIGELNKAGWELVKKV